MDAVTLGAAQAYGKKHFANQRPGTYTIFTGKADGSYATTDTGEAVSVFGNSPLGIVGGVLTSTSLAVSANASGYAQHNLGSNIVVAGCEAVFDPGAGGGIAIVLPSQPWTNGNFPAAGVHFVAYGDGTWHVSYWTGTAETYYIQGRLQNTMWDSQPRVYELQIDRNASTLSIYLPDGTVAFVNDTRIASKTSTYAIFECYTYNATGTGIPAKFKSTWAHGTAHTVTPRNPHAGASRGDVARAIGRSSRQIVEYTATASAVNVPLDAVGCLVTIIAGGGGGGSGRRGAAGTVRCGGGGGGSGGVINDQWIPAGLLGTTYTVTIGAPGAGGAAVTTDDTNGNSGSGGGAITSFASGGVTLKALGGFSGGGGTASAGTAGGNGAPGGSSGAAASGTGGVGGTGSQVTSLNPGAPGAGGGITSANVASNGGPGGASYLWGNGAGGSGGVVDTTVPGQGPAASSGRPGDAPGGGAASITTAAQAGGDGLGYGVGGGGGGASLNGFASGRGGNGGPAYVRLTWIYH